MAGQMTGDAGPVTTWIRAASPPMTLVLVLQGLYGLGIARHLGDLSAGVAALTIAYFVPDGIARRLVNDYQDHRHGLDQASRARPGSALGAGLDMRLVRRVALAAAACAAVMAICIAVLTIPWLLLVLPVFGVVYLSYSGGPRPLGYRGVGELMDFLLTGTGVTFLVVVVNVRTMDVPSALACAGLGCMFGTFMLHNNARDVEKDRAAGKRTLPQKIGPGGTKALYAVAVAGYYASVVAYSLGEDLRWPLLPLLTLPWALWLVLRFARSDLGPRIMPWIWTFRLMLANLALFIAGAFS